MVNHDLLTFGPVPSRRLGRSLGINNIPPKVCSYSCIYCQLGRTLNMWAERKVFYNPDELLKSVKKKVKDAKNKGESIDYLTFVPDGEPTLDINLGKVIKLFRPLGTKIAVISNASLIWQDDVQDGLRKADWVSLKIDAVSENVWRKINRPHKFLQLDKILQGITEFSRIFTGKLATETMLIHDVNDSVQEMERIAGFIAGLKNVKSYISIPTRPPAEKWAKSADEHAVSRAYQLFKEEFIDTEYLIGYEGNAFAFTGNIEEDLLSITSVHPMRKEAVDEFLKKANGDWAIIDKLITENKLVKTEYKDNRFYMRKI
jgi:wyosine [tRNA(Phe)-imidazoG37] synthetase (radical SAM superfamily)